MKKTFSLVFNRFSSVFLVAVFTLNSVVISPSYIYASLDTNKLERDGLSYISLQNLPAELGLVKEFQEGSPNVPFIIHVQDAHAIPDAQKKISQILHWIHDQAPQKKLEIGLEGSAGRIEHQTG